MGAITCMLAALAVAAPAGSLDPATALKLLQRSAILGPRSGRVEIRVLRIAPMSEPAGLAPGFFVEVGWREGEKKTGGIAAVMRSDELAPDVRILGQDGDWALLDLAIGKTWDEMAEELRVARDAALEAKRPGQSARGRSTASDPVDSAMGDVRRVLSAQNAFMPVSQGDYAYDVACLVRPADCVPGYEGPALLDDVFLRAERNGYRFTLRALAKPGSARLATAFTYSAVPVTPGPGRPGFCVDDSGRVCQTGDGSDAGSHGDACAPSCRDVR